MTVHYDQPISAAKAQLDSHVRVRNAIETANNAILDALRVAVEFEDPNAPNIFGADMEVLRRIAALGKAKLLPITMTGIAIFALRIDTEEFISNLERDEGKDAAFMSLLKSYGQDLAISSL